MAEWGTVGESLSEETRRMSKKTQKNAAAIPISAGRGSLTLGGRLFSFGQTHQKCAGARTGRIYTMPASKPQMPAAKI
jgi:hypothetical protein